MAMDVNVPDQTLLNRLRGDAHLAAQYRRIAEYFFRHSASVSTSMTEPLSDSAKQLFESGVRYLPYVLNVDVDFLSMVTSLNIPDAAAIKLQTELPNIGFDAKAYIAERNARNKAAEKGKRA
jgi:hypothetical protein